MFQLTKIDVNVRRKLLLVLKVTDLHEQSLLDKLETTLEKIPELKICFDSL